MNNFIDALTEKAESDMSVNIIFRDAAGNSEKQLQDIRSLTECGIDLLIVSPNDSNSLNQVLQETFRKIPHRYVYGFPQNHGMALSCSRNTDEWND